MGGREPTKVGHCKEKFEREAAWSARPLHLLTDTPRCLPLRGTGVLSAHGVGCIGECMASPWSRLARAVVRGVAVAVAAEPNSAAKQQGAIESFVASSWSLRALSIILAMLLHRATVW